MVRFSSTRRRRRRRRSSPSTIGAVSSTTRVCACVRARVRACLPARSLELTRNRGNVDGDKWSRRPPAPLPGGWTDKLAFRWDWIASRKLEPLFSSSRIFGARPPIERLFVSVSLPGPRQPPSPLGRSWLRKQVFGNSPWAAVMN